MTEPSKIRMKAGMYSVDVRQFLGDSTHRDIVMIHGIGVSGDYFLPFAPLLAPHFNVHVIDFPGYGKTPRPDHPLSPAELADVAAKYVDTNNISSALIVGQSMGCQTAAHLAVHRPDLCSKLLLVGPTVNKNERNRAFQALRLAQDTLREPWGMNMLIFRDYLRMGVMRYLKTARMMVTDHLEETLKEAKQPVLIVRGSKDPIVPREWTEWLATRQSNIHTVEVAGAPHNVQYARPKELLATCEAFLKG